MQNMNSQTPAEQNAPSPYCNTMGVQDLRLAGALLRQMTNAWAGPEETYLENSELGLQLTKELAPRNTMEALLLTQMAACHSHCMSMFASAGKSICEDSQTKYLRLAERLMRSFSTSLETLEKARRGGKQSVKVEHVHVNAGGQAIVGNVNQGERDHEQQ